MRFIQPHLSPRTWPFPKGKSVLTTMPPLLTASGCSQLLWVRVTLEFLMPAVISEPKSSLTRCLNARLPATTQKHHMTRCGVLLPQRAALTAELIFPQRKSDQLKGLERRKQTYPSPFQQMFPTQLIWKTSCVMEQPTVAS